MYHNLTTVSPGEFSGSALIAKKKIRTWLSKGNASNKKLATRINVTTSKGFGTDAVEGCRRFQRAHNLTPTGTVDWRTWLKLGFKEENILEWPGHALRGVPWEPGVVPIDGNWLNVKSVRILRGLRKARKWSGTVTSGWRPDWYQALLWKAAVKRYGSEAAAAKWVARPGSSNHRFRTDKGAVDLERADQVLKAKVGFYQPMSWEDWHLQLKAAYGRSASKLRTAAGVRYFVDDLGEAQPSAFELQIAAAAIEEYLDTLPGE